MGRGERPPGEDLLIVDLLSEKFRGPADVAEIVVGVEKVQPGREIRGKVPAER